jgi:protein-S-isoprenylcysteine O-methyltransferase Ste14
LVSYRSLIVERFSAASMDCWTTMTPAISFAGLTAALVLIGLLGTSWHVPNLRIWPTPESGSWQSVLFWTLFRASNITALVLAVLAILSPEQQPYLPLPDALRAGAAIVAAISILLYGLSLFTLGRPNTYCGHAGLIRSGIYRWTRNPQYATIIPFYAALAVAANAPWLYLQATGLIAIYILMALNEEPWLRARYGAGYEAYCKEVSRFFDFRHALAQLRSFTSQPGNP